jgi:outer membrane lipoprotein-sorting protein
MPTLAAFVLAGAFGALQAQWADVRDYSVTIDARETLGNRTESNVVSYRFRQPDRARLEIVSGPHKGSVLVWRGGSDVVAYHSWLRFVKVHYKIDAQDVTSLRGNDVLAPDLDTLIACFAEHPDRLSEHPGQQIDGEPTTVVEMAREGISCRTDSVTDRAVTRDVVYLSDGTHLPLLRERYVGALLVERWKLSDLKINRGLPDGDFQ